jgi:pheromone shutdown protein TraB
MDWFAWLEEDEEESEEEYEEEEDEEEWGLYAWLQLMIVVIIMSLFCWGCNKVQLKLIKRWICYSSISNAIALPLNWLVGWLVM